MLSKNSKLKIALTSKKEHFDNKVQKKWGTQAEQTATVNLRDRFLIMSRSGEPIQSLNSVYTDKVLVDPNAEIGDLLIDSTAREEVVSMGDYKDKKGTPTVSQGETVGKEGGVK